jgi:hypothetical protein
MSSLSQFAGGARVPRAIINSFSTGGGTIFAPFLSNGFTKKSTTGAVTANTLVTALSLTGSGVVNYFAAYSNDATSRTHRVRVTIDGTVVFDATSGACTTTGDGVMPIGNTQTSNFTVYDQIPYNTSFLVEYASSLSETAKTGFAYIYRTN